ncbi:MAG: Rrf2 family transcriptional regulator [Roseburia sp.]|nr:Rrf2 family transcriptional regulator [Lachnospiraceae bacterium]MBQ5851583.1 Rrf2 family transcriptional regulator [Lachnospiraceae bacterium]MBQ8280540.1 Rrf2 family transcriptional regulator [Roseburia sp.]MBQ8728392.1 Rrf2 family transcriptional regulator [Oscillospiraceae bacterium]
MKISTKGRYALRLMIDLATNDDGNPIRIKDVAERQNISDKYLEQIISALNKAGFVRSVRGPQGGYSLKKKPEDYTVGMILRLTEGSLAPVACVEEDETDCERQGGCVTYLLWRKISDAINGVVDTITLKDLIDWQKNIGNNE